MSLLLLQAPLLVAAPARDPLTRLAIFGYSFIQKAAVGFSVGLGTIFGLGMLDDVQSPGLCEVIPPGAKVDVDKNVQTAPSHPYFVEFCFSGNAQEKEEGEGEQNISFHKLHDFMAKFPGMATHGLIYVQGLDLDRTGNDRPDYVQTLKLSEPTQDGEAPNGVGLSTNFYTRNAFTVTPGRDFVFYGGLKNHEVLTKDKKNEVTKELVKSGYLKGVHFQTENLPIHRSGPNKGKPMDPLAPETQEILTKWDFGWSWGLALARPVYCSRISLTGKELIELKDYLNTINHSTCATAQGNKFNMLKNNC